MIPRGAIAHMAVGGGAPLQTLPSATAPLLLIALCTRHKPEMSLLAILQSLRPGFSRPWASVAEAKQLMSQAQPFETTVRAVDARSLTTAEAGALVR